MRINKDMGAKMKKNALGILIISLFLIAACSSPEQTPTPQPQPTPQPTPQPQVNDKMEDDATENVVEINMIARQWEFEPDTVTVKEGDTVRLIINSVDVDHGIGINAFGINERLNAGEVTTIEFVADKKGTYSFFCSVFCGSGHSGMKGALVVE